MVIVKLGTGGKISLFTPTSTDVVIDVLGWFPATGSFTGLVPARLMDTRPSTAVGALTPGTSWQWQIDGNAINETVLDAVHQSEEDVRHRHVHHRQRRPSSASTPRASTSCATSRRAAGRTTDPTPAATRRACSATRWPAIRTNDSSTSARSSVLQPIIAARFDTAKAKGCDGIEPDLDDTYNGYNTGFPLTMQDQLTFNKAIADLAHARGMSIGLKNGASGGVFEQAMVQFTDWALNEECNQFGECGGYNVYIAANKAVFQVEYSASGTTTAQFCPADNAANFDGILKQSSASLGALPRIACRNG